MCLGQLQGDPRDEICEEGEGDKAQGGGYHCSCPGPGGVQGRVIPSPSTQFFGKSYLVIDRLQGVYQEVLR